ncbi:KRAB-A domain-containing protein 2-like [Daktulosphaira vitifoliae]|uniref:KRAB-A domain-containing protein 2-like n=1 Tax=Daktulosphaira vitifoliae TaxID=58002 RepID=UPI0021A9AD38|nr:KRAB-A domain-containing protein 2-like [Daktulosphaira vitifoliae]
MDSELKSKYCNITNETIMAYLNLCTHCQKKSSNPKRGLVSKPILHSTFNSRAQIDLIDMQSQNINGFRFILNYQDHLTKFVLLRALSSKRAEEIANNLLDIYTTFGAPVILHSDNGREFVNSIIIELHSMWPDVKIVHGKPRHSQSQGSVKRANRDVDRARGSSRNLLAVIANVDNGFYKLCTENGFLKHKYTRSQFMPCKEILLDLKTLLESSKEKEITFREAAGCSSLMGTQDYQRCHYKMKSKTNKCTCRVVGKLCNSKCNSSLSCENK